MAGHAAAPYNQTIDRDRTHQNIENIFREESGRVIATLVRILGDLDLAEDAMQEAFAAALQQWPTAGVPSNPRAWLISTARFKAIDSMRRLVRFLSSTEDMEVAVDPQTELYEVADDTLRLIFTCCHPALSPEAQVALTLREVCGLTTDEIASAFLTSNATIAQRIVRAKARIREASIPYVVPDADGLPERLDSVLRVTYLVYNEGYYASSGESATRFILSREAIRLGRLLAELLPESEVFALLALMLFNESRRTARTSATGDIVLLDDQDRSRWDRAMIAEAQSILARSERGGTYALQAKIAEQHSIAANPSETNWGAIVSHYDAMLVVQPSPIVELNRAVAVAMRDGPQAGLNIIDSLILSGQLLDYGHAHSAKAEFCRRLGRLDEARASFERALDLATQEPEKRFLRGRLQEISEES